MSGTAIATMGSVVRVDHPGADDQAFWVNWDFGNRVEGENPYTAYPDHPKYFKARNAAIRAYESQYFLTGSIPRPPSPLPKGVVIVGAGAFGLTTALHMVRRGIRPVQVVEAKSTIANLPYDCINNYQMHTPVAYDYAPQGEGAAHYRNLFNESMANFIHDLVLRTFFRVTGYAHVVGPTSPPEAREAVRQARNEVRAAAPGTVEDLIEICGASALRTETDIVLLRGGLPFKGYVNRHGAVLETADALYALYIEALKLGVSFTFQEEVDALWWDEHGRCTGVVSSKHSRVHTADAVIVAAGASIPGIVPAAAGQLTPTAYVTAHVELTSEELWCLQGIPVLHVPDLGYLTSPDEQTHLLQVCVTSWEWEYAGRDGRLTVLGRADVLPPPAEERMRKLLRVTLPWLEHRELVYPRMVWTTRTTDGHFLMDKVPGTENVYVAVGDMDKSIGLLPLLGREVTDMVLRGEQKRPLWRWKGQDRARPLGKEGFDYDTYFGGQGSLRERERKANARRGVRGSYSPKRAFEFRIEDQLVIEPGMMRCSDLHPSKRRKYPTTTMPPQFLWRKTKSKAKSASKQSSA